MKTVRKIINGLFDFIEVYIPMITFIMVFVLYVIMIVMRYFTLGKIGKYYELCQISFIWCSVLSASYGGRTGQHVMFGIVYDKCSQRTQAILRVIGDILVVVAFIIILPHAYEAIDFLKIKKSDQLRLRFNLIYSPFIVFLSLTTIHYLTNFVKDIKVLKNMGKGEIK